MMSGAIAVDNTAGGVAVMTVPTGTRLLFIDNTGANAASLKLDGSSTALTAANGKQIAAGGSLVIGFAPSDLQTFGIQIKAFSTAGTTIVAQSVP